jgi:hypothetical protein
VHAPKPTPSVRRWLISHVVVAAIAIGACAGGPPPAPHAALTASGDPLRAQFNRDAGFVRIVILAAPT